MDEAKVGALSKRIMGIYEGALVSGMVYLGDEMGLYRAMHEQGSLTSEQVATIDKCCLLHHFVPFSKPSKASLVKSGACSGPSMGRRCRKI